MLDGRVAIITGSVRGTGEGIAKTFARAGASIVLNQVRDEGDPDRVLGEVQALGGRAMFVHADGAD